MGKGRESHLQSHEGFDEPAACIIQTPGVAGGERHIVGTRIPVWSLEDARRRGINDDRILEMYPTIDRAQLQAAHSYASFHVAEMDRLIACNSE